MYSVSYVCTYIGTGEITTFDILDKNERDVANSIISKSTPIVNGLVDCESGMHLLCMYIRCKVG